MVLKELQARKELQDHKVLMVVTEPKVQTVHKVLMVLKELREISVELLSITSF